MTEESRTERKDRSTRLLRPKLRILLYVYRMGKVPYNITDLGKKLDYPKSGSFNELVNELLEAKLLEPTLDGRFLRTTKEGAAKIKPLVLGRVFSLMIVILSFIPLMWGVSEFLFGVPIGIFTLLATGGLMAMAGLFLLYMQVKLEERLLGID